MADRSQRPVWLGVDQRGWDHVRVHVQLLKDARIGAYEIAVYVGIAAHAELASGRAYPSEATLGRYTGLSERTIRTVVKRLEQAGYVRVERTPGAASTYYLLPVTPAPHSGVTPARNAGDPGTTFRTTPAPDAAEQEPGNKNQGTMLPPDGGPDFEEAWQAYPKRNGRRVGKEAAKALWGKLPLRDRPMVLEAIRAYATAVARSETIPRDAERFFKNQYWKDWVPDAPLKSAAVPERPCDLCDDRRWVYPDDPEDLTASNEVVPCPKCRGGSSAS